MYLGYFFFNKIICNDIDIFGVLYLEIRLEFDGCVYCYWLIGFFNRRMDFIG